MTGHEHEHHTHDHDSWEDKAGWYIELVDHLEPVLGPVTEALLDHTSTRSGTRVLDVACGAGHTAAAATARGAHALGIDLSDAMIGAARERFPSTEFQVADGASPPAGPWDVAVCRFGAHHLPEGWVEALARVLKPGGCLAIAEWPPLDADDEANGMRPAEHWETLLANAGFTEVQVLCTPTPLATYAEGRPELQEHLAAHDHALTNREAHIVSARAGREH